MPPLCRSSGLSGSRLFIHIEGIHFQNSTLSLAEMTLSNYVNIKYFLIIHSIGQAVIHIMCDSNENAKLIVPWVFFSPYQLSRHLPWIVLTKHICAQEYLDSDWLHGSGFPDAFSRNVSWGKITECWNWKEAHCLSLILPMTQLRLREVTWLSKGTACGERAKIRSLVQDTQYAVIMTMKVLPTLWGI